MTDQTGWHLVTLKGHLPAVRTVRMPHGEANTYTATIQTHDGKHVCRLDFGYGHPTNIATAHLIAAAPDLLAALKEFVEWHGGAHADGCPEDDTCDCIGGAINVRVNAAIRKAEGQP